MTRTLSMLALVDAVKSLVEVHEAVFIFLFFRRASSANSRKCQDLLHCTYVSAEASLLTAMYGLVCTL